MGRTLEEAQAAAELVNERGIEEVVADKGYHSGAVLEELHQQGMRSYIPEPQRKRRRWKDRRGEQKRVYANRGRVRAARGKRLQKKRSELTERTFAHMYETGGMRRVSLRGRENVLKRLLVQAAGFNLALVMRQMFGVGKPRQLQGAFSALFSALIRCMGVLWAVLRAIGGIDRGQDQLRLAVRAPLAV